MYESPEYTTVRETPKQTKRLYKEMDPYEKDIVHKILNRIKGRPVNYSPHLRSKLNQGLCIPEHVLQSLEGRVVEYSHTIRGTNVSHRLLMTSNEVFPTTINGRRTQARLAYVVEVESTTIITAWMHEQINGKPPKQNMFRYSIKSLLPYMEDAYNTL